MKTIQRGIFIISILLLIWLFFGNFPEFDLARVKKQSFYSEQISEIENTQSIQELKKIAKSKVIQTENIHATNDWQRQNQLYIITVLIIIQLFLFTITNKTLSSKT